MVWFCLFYSTSYRKSLYGYFCACSSCTFLYIVSRNSSIFSFSFADMNMQFSLRRAIHVRFSSSSVMYRVNQQVQN